VTLNAGGTLATISVATSTVTPTWATGLLTSTAYI